MIQEQDQLGLGETETSLAGGSTTGPIQPLHALVDMFGDNVLCQEMDGGSDMMRLKQR